MESDKFDEVGNRGFQMLWHDSEIGVWGEQDVQKFVVRALEFTLEGV
jgi:hypothetical protein